MVGPSRRALAAVVLLGLGCATAVRIPASQAPSSVRLLDGSTVSWHSLVEGQGQGPTLVVFATLWCEICRRERPQVEAWARAHRETRRTVYVFSGGELPGMADQIAALHLDASALTVVVDADGRLADHYAVESTPTLLVVGSQGRVLSTHHRFQAVDLD